MKQNNKKTKCEIHYVKCNPTETEISLAIIDLVIVLSEGEKELLEAKGEKTSKEDKEKIAEYAYGIALLEQLKEKYQEFESHKGAKNSRKSKNYSTQGQTILLKRFEV